MMLSDSLERNDIDGAVAAYREAVQLSRTRAQLADVTEELLMMQDTEDDGNKLIARIEAVNEEPAIKRRLAQLGPLTIET